MRGLGSRESSAAKATAGMARAMRRTGMEYVRFVSKRGTVAGFRSREGDRAHSAHICVRICTNSGVNRVAQGRLLKAIVRVNAR